MPWNSFNELLLSTAAARRFLIKRHFDFQCQISEHWDEWIRNQADSSHHAENLDLIWVGLTVDWKNRIKLAVKGFHFQNSWSPKKPCYSLKAHASFNDSKTFAFVLFPVLLRDFSFSWKIIKCKNCLWLPGRPQIHKCPKLRWLWFSTFFSPENWKGDCFSLLKVKR